MKHIEAFNILAAGKELTVDFMSKEDAVGYRNTLATVYARKYDEYVAYGLLQNPKPTLTSKESIGECGLIRMTFKLEGRPRKTFGPVSFKIIDPTENNNEPTTP